MGKGFLLHRDGEERSYIEISSNIPQLAPLFLEYANQYFCVIQYDEVRSHRRSPFPRSSVGCFPGPRHSLHDMHEWRKVLWGRFAPAWDGLPMVTCSVAMENHHSEVTVSTGDLAAVLEKELRLLLSPAAIVCFGDDECWKFMAKSTEYRCEVLIPSDVWAQLLRSFTARLPFEQVPELVRKNLVRGRKKALEEKEKLQKEMEDLRSRTLQIADEISALETTIIQYGNLGVE